MVFDGENKPLFQCRVLYIGSAVPLEQSKGLEAIQQPLRERYPVGDEKSISGVDATLAVLPSEIQMTDISKDAKTVVCFPISSLTFCAAVRCIYLMSNDGTKVPQFVSLNSPAAGGINAHRPAIFAAITRRLKGRKVLECHAYLCASPTDAKNLVQASKMADRAYRGGAAMNGFNSIYGHSVTNTLNSRPVTEAGVHLVPADQKSVKSEVPQEFYEAPPPRGYFYTSGPDHVKSYTVERVGDSLSNGTLPNGVRTLERPDLRMMVPYQPRMVNPRQLMPAQSQVIRYVSPMSMKKGRPIVMNTLPPPPLKRFLSPPPQAMVARNDSRKDPYIYMQPRIPTYSYRMPYRPPKDHSPSSSYSSESGEIPNTNLSPSNSAKLKAKNGATNGNDASYSNRSSRSASPEVDYEPSTAPDIQKSRMSRREQHERSKHQQQPSMPLGMVQPIMYPYNPYMYPAYYVAQPMLSRPSSVPPPLDAKESNKNWRKKKDKKSKKKTKSQPVDISGDVHGYSSEALPGTENYLRRSMDRTRIFQNERAFAHSIVEEDKNRPFALGLTPYNQFKDTDLLY